MRLAVCTALVSTLSAIALPAFAQAPPPPPAATAGDEVVYLKDGGMLRGTFIEIIPNDHVTLSLANGQTARVDWSLVLRVERSAAGAAPTTSPAPAKTAVVHIESERSVRLEVVSGKTNSFVCLSPCDKEVDLGATYRISGDGVRASRPFSIDAQAGQRVVIEVDTASKAAFVGGIVLVSISPVVALVGLVVWAINAVDNDEGGRVVGIGLAVGGAVALTGGIIMIASNSSSKQTQTVAAPPPRAARDPLFAEITPLFSAPAPVMFNAPVVRF